MTPRCWRRSACVFTPSTVPGWEAATSRRTGHWRTGSRRRELRRLARTGAVRAAGVLVRLAVRSGLRPSPGGASYRHAPSQRHGRLHLARACLVPSPTAFRGAEAGNRESAGEPAYLPAHAAERPVRSGDDDKAGPCDDASRRPGGPAGASGERGVRSHAQRDGRPGSDAVNKWEQLDTATLANGDVMTLHRRGDEYSLRVANFDLMNSRQHGSEERLAELAVAKAGDLAGAAVLVGGLGMGFTLRAALDLLPADARVNVAEQVPQVGEWNS